MEHRANNELNTNEHLDRTVLTELLAQHTEEQSGRVPMESVVKR